MTDYQYLRRRFRLPLLTALFLFRHGFSFQVPLAQSNRQLVMLQQRGFSVPQYMLDALNFLNRQP